MISAAGNLWLRRSSSERFTGQDHPLSRADLRLVTGCILFNALVSVAGWRLWRENILQLRPSALLATLISLTAFILLMDLFMYVTHRMAHWPLFYRWFHHRHHEHLDTNPFSLFVLHPFEVLAFGATLIVVIWLVKPTVEALNAYLFLNVVFGSLGHADADLMPARWSRGGWLRWIGLGRFHADHHRKEQNNFGFYTTLWDRLAGTLADAGKTEPCDIVEKKL